MAEQNTEEHVEEAGAAHDADAPAYATSSDYVNHHLGFLTYGKYGEKEEDEIGSDEFPGVSGEWGFAHSAAEATNMGFKAIHVDTMLMSLLLGLVFVGLFFKVSRKVTSGVPGGLQNAVEFVVEMVQTNIKNSFHGKCDYLGPLALTIFCWIFLMNLMDLVPVDLIPLAAQAIAGDQHLFFKAVPTTDINITLAFALSVFFLMIYYSIKIKGIGGFLGEFFFQPFGKKAFLINPILELPGFLAKPVSLSLRLYGNLFAGEVIFLIIALLGYYQLPFHFAWSVFHILVIVLQSYLFMMLTIVYLNQAHSEH